MVEPLYYRNIKGAVALSVDDGETVWTPEGRNIPMTPVWEWTDEDNLEPLLGPEQAMALKEALESPPLSEIEELTLLFHKRQLAAKKDYYQPPPPPISVRESVLVVSSDPDD